MLHLTKLKSARSFKEIAAILGYKASALSYILYKKGNGSNYRQFDIPKRYGGTRRICAPTDQLKLLQKKLAKLLQDCSDEIRIANKREEQQLSHGFMRHRTIITNAKLHRNRRYVFNIDLTNFFGSINFGRVRGFFVKDKHFSLNDKVATVIAQIACYQNSLPQGSPCSPVVSNLIGHILDIHLVRLAEKNDCIYSRYADDITFSSNKKEFPASIASCLDSEANVWLPGYELQKLIKLNGFSVNPHKTRMQYHNSRQEVTGLIVNQKVNVRSDYRHKVRAMVHRLFTKGHFDFEYKENTGKERVIINKIPGSLNELHGMLGFIDGIDLYNKGEKRKKEESKRNGELKLTSRETIYCRFLLYKEFYVSSLPVIICEGKTDNTYLLHAIRSLATQYPQLATKNPDGTIKLKIRIFKYTNNATGRILGIKGGTGELGKFITLYDHEIRKFTAPGEYQPIILLVDNDDGFGAISKSIEKITQKKPDNREKFIHVSKNLYVVATPLEGKDKSTIENCFNDETISIKLDNKRFTSANKVNSDTEYGKYIFAEKVIKPNAHKIDFSGFNSLLSILASVIDVHSKKTII